MWPFLLRTLNFFFPFGRQGGKREADPILPKEISVFQILFFLCSGKAVQRRHSLGQHLCSLILPGSTSVSQQSNGCCHSLPPLSGLAQRASRESQSSISFRLKTAQFVLRNRILTLGDFVPWNIVLVNKCLWYIFNMVLKICISLCLCSSGLLLNIYGNDWLHVFWAAGIPLIMFTNTSPYFSSLRVLTAARSTVTYELPRKIITSWFKMQRPLLLPVSCVGLSTAPKAPGLFIGFIQSPTVNPIGQFYEPVAVARTSNASHRLMCLSAWLPQLVVLFGAVVELLGSRALLKEVGQLGWALAFYRRAWFPVPCLLCEAAAWPAACCFCWHASPNMMNCILSTLSPYKPFLP